MRRFLEALFLVEKVNNGGATVKSSVTRGALGGTHSDNTLFSRADDHDVLRYIGAAAAHRRGRKQNTAFNVRALYSYAALLLKELQSLHTTACEKYPFNLDSFLLIQIRQTKTYSLPVKKGPLHSKSFLLRPSGKK